MKKVLTSITPAIYQNLQQAVELGKWSDGRMLTKQQREDSMQLIIAYDNKFKMQQQRVGFIEDANCSSKNNEANNTYIEQELVIKN